MRHVSMVCVVVGLVLVASSTALAQEATNAWGGSWDFRNPNERTAALNRAQLMHQAENGGLTVVTNIAGDVNYTSTYEGPVNQSSSTNVGNMSSTTTNVNARGSNVTLRVTTGQTTTNVNQGADSDSSSNDWRD